MVVSFNYREGIEGYARIEGAQANRGLLDQVAALHWVQDNIAAFGGDAHQVTAFGQSAGAGAVATLLATPSAVGLLSRGIIQSLPGTFFSDELAADIAATMAAEVQAAPPTAADLSVVDPRPMPAAGADLAAKISQYADRWGPLSQATGSSPPPRAGLEPAAYCLGGTTAPAPCRPGTTHVTSERNRQGQLLYERSCHTFCTGNCNSLSVAAQCMSAYFDHDPGCTR